MTGMLTFEEVKRLREEERQTLINKYQQMGYYRPWAIAKADFEIEEIRQSNINKLTALRELTPTD